VLIYKNIDYLQNHLHKLNFGTKYNMKINTNKTVFMTISKDKKIANLTINGGNYKPNIGEISKISGTKTVIPTSDSATRQAR
jgi:hypothetical protein